MAGRVIMMALCLLPLCLNGCAGRTHVQAFPEKIERVWRPLIDHCTKHPETVECPKEIFRVAVKGCITTRDTARKCLSALKDSEEKSGVRAEVAAGQLATAEAERDQALRDRWLWGSVALAVGIALGVTGMALAF